MDFDTDKKDKCQSHFIICHSTRIRRQVAIIYYVNEQSIRCDYGFIISCNLFLFYLFISMHINNECVRNIVIIMIIVVTKEKNSDA